MPWVGVASVPSPCCCLMATQKNSNSQHSECLKITWEDLKNMDIKSLPSKILKQLVCNGPGQLFFFDSCIFKSSWHSKVQLGQRTNWFIWHMWRSSVKRTVPATGSCSVNNSDDGDGETRGRGERWWGTGTILPDNVRHNVLVGKDDITPVFCQLILFKNWFACPPSHK